MDLGLFWVEKPAGYPYVSPVLTVLHIYSQTVRRCSVLVFEQIMRDQAAIAPGWWELWAVCAPLYHRPSHPWEQVGHCCAHSSHPMGAGGRLLYTYLPTHGSRRETVVHILLPTGAGGRLLCTYPSHPREGRLLCTYPSHTRVNNGRETYTPGLTTGERPTHPGIYQGGKHPP